ncbi:MAG: hypothetical protein H6Q69_2729 [Firmicutes bacterium]|nr:hypothetical protein [Bacillota bacterium]
MNPVEIAFFVQYKCDDGYEIVNAEKSDLANYIAQNKEAYASMGGESIVCKGDSHSSHKNLIEKHTKLFTEFANLGNRKENIICFADKYGLLLPPESFTVPSGCKVKNEEYTSGERLAFWRQQIRLMFTALQAWQWFDNNDINMLRNVITQEGYLKYRFDFSDYSQEFRIHEWQIQEQDDNNLLYNHLLSDDVLLQTKFFVQQIINKQLEAFPIKPALVFDNKNNLNQYFCPSSLISLMWFQFFRYVTGQQKIKQCPICKDWYDVSDESAETRWTNRCPICANRLRVQKTSIKKRYLSGMSVDEIIKRTKKTSPDIIKEWIQEWDADKNTQQD